MVLSSTRYRDTSSPAVEMKHLTVSILFAVLFLGGVGQIKGEPYSYSAVIASVEHVVEKPAAAQAVEAPVKDWPENCYRPDAQDRRLAACQALQDAGFDKNGIQMMLAISQGESGIRLDAVGDQHLANTKWSSSRGAWQIRSLHAEKGSGRCRDEQALISQGWAFHAKCAFDISGGGRNYKPWTIFLNGSYRKYL